MRGLPARFGRFKLVERLGVGGMAELFRAELSGPYGFAKTVAIKKILPELNRLKRFREMFLRESRIMSALHHGNLVQVNELGEVDGELFMCLEYVQGCDLARLLRHQALTGSPLPGWLSIWIVREVARGLGYLHGLTDERGEGRAIVHRDVNPHNILLSIHGDVKLGDFGIAKGLSDELHTRQGQVKGKLEYLSPEQARGDALGPASDLYSLGLVLFELLTGQRYLRGESDFALMQAAAKPTWRSPREINPAVEPAQEEVLARMLRPDPQARFGSADALVAALDPLWIGRAKTDPADVLARLVEAVRGSGRTASVVRGAEPDASGDPADADPLRMVPPDPGEELRVRRTGTLAIEELPAARSRGLLVGGLMLIALVLAAAGWWLLRPASQHPPGGERSDAGTAAALVADAGPEGTDDPPRPAATVPSPDAGVAPAEETMALVDRLLAEEDDDLVASAEPVERTAPRKPRRKRKKRKVRKAAAPVAVEPESWSADQRSRWRQRLREQIRKARQRGLRPGDCPACDGYARDFARAFKGQDEAGAQAALEGYGRALAEVQVDGAFMDRKLRRLRAALERRGKARAHQLQVDRILKEIVDGRLEQANRAINQLLDAR